MLAAFDPDPEDQADTYVDRAMRLVWVAKRLARAELGADRRTERVLAVAIILANVCRVFQGLYTRGEHVPPVVDLDAVLASIEAWIEQRAFNRYMEEG